VVTTSFNKGIYLPELRAALEKQTAPPGEKVFTWWIMDNSLDRATRKLVLEWQAEELPWLRVTTHDFTEEERQQKFAHPVLLNLALRELEDGSVIHVSDDDLPQPRFMETLLNFLGFNKDKEACYVPTRWVFEEIEGDGFTEGGVMPTAPVVFRKGVDPFAQLDGNSVLATVSALKEIGDTPWPEDWESAFICDGHMLRSLAERNQIWPAADSVLLLHRTTRLSTFNNTIRGPTKFPDPLGRDLSTSSNPTVGISPEHQQRLLDRS